MELYQLLLAIDTLRNKLEKLTPYDDEFHRSVSALLQLQHSAILELMEELEKRSSRKIA